MRSSSRSFFKSFFLPIFILPLSVCCYKFIPSAAENQYLIKQVRTPPVRPADGVVGCVYESFVLGEDCCGLGLRAESIAEGTWESAGAWRGPSRA
ncbi:hypothetical protein DXA34_02385 [[Clostridium] symbiosum]|nr:hypothetical protein DXA34_02385 [[Clostridium] symbiosum]